MRVKQFLCGWVSLLVFCAIFCAGAGLAGSTGAALADLSADIRQVLSEKVLLKASSAVQVVKLGATQKDCIIVYERNSHLPLQPASNLKILTTSSALNTLGPQFRFRTLLVQHGNDLIIWGDGDPTLGDAKFADRLGTSQMSVIQSWVEQVKALGITSVDRVLVDDSVFDTEFLHPRWAKHRAESFGAEVGGVNFGANLIEFAVRANKNGTSYSTNPPTSYVRVTKNSVTAGPNAIRVLRGEEANEISLRGTVNGSCEFTMTIQDPPLYAATVLADLLKRNGVTVSGAVERDRGSRQRFVKADAASRGHWRTLKITETPLDAVITHTNKESMNMYAEALCKRQAVAAGQSGSWAAGNAVSSAFLKKLGVPENEFRLDDGSGLSADNAITTNALVRVLIQDFYSSGKDIMVNSLAVGGVDGTLRKRFDPSLHGRVYAKTGYISTACALTGYLHAKSGDWYAFSIIFNNMGEPVRPLQDRIVKAIDDASVAK